MSDPTAPAAAIVASEAALSAPGGPGEAGDQPPARVFVGRSPGQLAWIRLKRDRTALVSGAALIFFLVLAAAAPLVELVYGEGPLDRFPDRLDRNGFPLGYSGIDAHHWLGILAGYLGGWVDAVITWVIDLVLAFPFFIFCFAFVPLAINEAYGPRDAVSPWFRGGLIVIIFVMFNWTYTARLVRGQVLSLREREFVDAARASGARLGHILFRQLLPNLWAPILVTFSLNVPSLITAEAALSFLNIGMVEPTPDLGRLINDSVDYIREVPTFTIVGGTTLFLIVLSFNLFGDSLRDALDPKSTR
jgi:peptide/nickel transport system permease protein